MFPEELSVSERIRLCPLDFYVDEDLSRTSTAVVFKCEPSSYRVGVDIGGEVFTVTCSSNVSGYVFSLGICSKEELLTHKCLQVRALAQS